jgi:hypothetical protein
MSGGYLFDNLFDNRALAQRGHYSQQCLTLRYCRVVGALGAWGAVEFQTAAFQHFAVPQFFERNPLLSGHLYLTH